MKHLLSTFCCLLLAQFLFAHGHHDHASADLKHWSLLTENTPIEASFLMFKDGEVFLEKADGEVAHFPLEALSEADQDFVQQRYAQIERLNHPAAQPFQHSFSTSQLLLFGLLALAFGGCVFWFFGKKRQRLSWAVMLALAAACYSFKPMLFGTDPTFIDSAFQPFKPAVYTRWDANWFYVESKGIPDHEMMTGITKWQQQVPIPQCYVGSNAWQIPLNPVLAATPVPVNPQHFLRGAVAIAANGIPIFNPYTNTGVDAYVDGQLDIFGGHCGRADDYHYHTAPLHLDAKTAEILPIAFALDGFAVYASLEPNGSPMAALDANHGHFGADGVYHYHGTVAAPYMIGNMVGQVTEDATMQIIPQAAAKPVRPSLTPLNGATITGCIPNATNNGYTLTYTRNGQVFSVEYSWTPTGKYTYNFISPTGTTTEVYNGAAPCAVPTATEDVFNSKYAVTIFPNPATSGFTVKWPDNIAQSEVQGVSVFDAAGKLVLENRGFVADFIVRNLPYGVYVVKVQFQKEQVTRKLVVQKF